MMLRGDRYRPFMRYFACGLAALCLLTISLSPAQEAAARKTIEVPEDFPRFIVPGYEKAMQSLRELYWLHFRPAGPLIPL